VNQRTLFLIFLLAFVSLMVLWQPWESEDKALEPDTAGQVVPDFTAENLVTRIFESNGRLSHRIRAKHMAHFSQQKLTELLEPVYITHLENQPEGAGELWQVKSQKGRFYNDEKLELITNVEVTNLSNIGYIRNIETDYLAIDLQTQKMYTESPVVISGPQFVIRGIGLTVDIESQQLELIKHVETVYYPSHVQR